MTLTGKSAAAALVLFAAFAACSAAQSPKPGATSDVVATVGTTPVTLAEVDERALQQQATAFGSVKLLQALFEARRAAVNEIVATRLIEQAAKAAGTDASTIEAKEITAKIAVPTDAEVNAWYGANQARVQGTPIDVAREPIRKFLLDQRTQAARQQYVDSLKAKTAVKISLDPPRQKVDAAGRPEMGPKNAPIEIVEFSDFQCPFCFRATPTVKQMLSTYGDRVHFVYRHFPLPNHPNARPAAEAAACAEDQGKFWPFHDRLFTNQTKLSDADLKQHASALGLDAGKFSDCVDNHKAQKRVEDDIAAGTALGVTGTPAFFINGRQVEGAVPFNDFKVIIDEELSARK